MLENSTNSGNNEIYLKNGKKELKFEKIRNTENNAGNRKNYWKLGKFEGKLNESGKKCEIARILSYEEEEVIRSYIG